MKQTLLLLTAAVLVVFGFNSCNEDITVSGNFQETAVVYGLLDQSDSVHLIKITRAFIGPGNSLEISQIPDSNYFQSVSATITEQFSGGVTGRTWTLFDTLVDTKETNGVFYAPEQIVYAMYSRSKDNSDNPTNAPLSANATYNLRILINEGTSSEFEVFGSTEIVSGISTSTDGVNYQFRFAENSVTTGQYVSAPMFVTHGNSEIVNTKLLIDIKEFVGTDSTMQRINWTWGEVPTGTGPTTNFNAQGESFYDLIASVCASGNPAVTRRNLEGITVEVVGGSEELYNYILVNQPSSSLAQNKPTYTNLTATNEHPVLGLFSSRYTHRVYHPMVSFNQNTRCMDRNSTMELCIGPITGQYLFCSQQPLDIVQGQPWACN
ncbi:MAG: hypothetical protein NXI10_15505 [bacterium]|nr:hypothetical protein [bacterium]